jgi:flagellar biosynthesis/type III secretory pathway protein FliH
MRFAALTTSYVLADNERERYQREYSDEANTMSTFAERFREEGRAQGMQQGVQQGMQQGVQRGMQQGVQRGEAAVLTRQLERKFGPVPEAARQRIEAADEETLLEWSERVLTATRIDDVFH